MNAATLIITAMISLHPAQDVTVDEVDLIELNHFYDDRGRLVLDQVIFYDWCVVEARFQVRDWRLLKSPAQIPRKNWRRGDFFTVWHDGDLLREVHAKGIHETWTQYDPELVEREFLPKEKRQKLRVPKTLLIRAP